MFWCFWRLPEVSALTGKWREFAGTTIQTLMISGLVGIFLGEIALFDYLSVWIQADQMLFLLSMWPGLFFRDGFF